MRSEKDRSVVGRKRPERKAMPKVESFDAGKLPPKDILQFTTDVNALIESYNNSDKDSEKKMILSKIQLKIKEIDYKYPHSYIAASPDYLNVHALLFKNIQYQNASLREAPSLEESSSMSEVIANMPPETLNKLLGMLIKDDQTNKKTQFEKLYEEDDESDEAIAFREFLLNHEITFSGGGNSKNFKVRCLIDDSESILKVDCRLDTPRNVEAHLREKLASCFVDIDTERLASCIDSKGQKICRPILVTEYCESGAINDFRDQLKTVPQLVKNTGTIFEKMAGIMLDLQKANCMFPDPKISNWLVDGKNIVIADTKSFVFTDSKGQYSRSAPGNEYSKFLTTSGFSAPEFGTGSFDADNAHAYLLGKNLYYFAAGKVDMGHDGSKFDFNKQLFKQPEGPVYKALIEDLVKPNPKDRISVSEALNRLFMINNPVCKKVFTDLHNLKFGAHDKEMNDFIRNKQNEINKAGPIKRASIITELENTVAALKADKAASEVRVVIDRFRADAGLLTVGMNAKADRIESAMSGVPIAERCKFLSSTKSTDVMKALASHRNFWKDSVYVTEKGDIDTDKAAQTFKDFKGKFKAQRAEGIKVDEPEEQVEAVQAAEHVSGPAI